MITLEMTKHEAEALYWYLGLHSTASALKTFDIFERISAIIDPDLSPEFAPVEHFDLLKRTRLSGGGLFVVDE